MFRRLWWGEYPLPRAFWGFYILGNLLNAMVAGAISGLFIVFHARPLGVMAATAAFVAYWAMSTIGTWRSATKYQGLRALAALAQVVILLFTVSEIWKLYDGLARSLFDQMVASK